LVGSFVRAKAIRIIDSTRERRLSGSSRWNTPFFRPRLALVVIFGLLLSIAVVSSAGAVAGGPTLLTSFDGPFDPHTGPPDATLAAGPSRLVELVNSQYAIVDRSGVGVTGPIRDLVGATPSDFLSDPQVAWDPESERFYYSIFENHGSSSPDEGIAWGFSKTDTPNSASDWCQYFTRFDYGNAAFPDRPSLGLSKNFVLFVSTRYGVPNENWEGVDLAWVTKPGKKDDCPSEKTLRSGITRLTDSHGGALLNGTAVREVDSSKSGWVIAQPSTSNANLVLFEVTKRGQNAIVSGPTAVAVPAYSYPAPAPQAGLTPTGQPARTLETKGYLTQAYAAFDPRLGHIDIWTAHGVAGGAGAAVRWYEINPEAANVDQVGTVSDPDLYVFNGTIAPDRLVNGKTAAFGSDMVMTVNTSSVTTDVAIGVVSKRGSDPQSPIVVVKTSPGPYLGNDCFGTTRPSCRWGDYSGTSPDPGAPTTGSSGQVWFTNQWNIAGGNEFNEAWRTFTALAVP
jgi:hypothetical protein